MSRYMVEDPMDYKGRTLFITKLLRRPLSSMLGRVNQLKAQDPNPDTLRYLLHSAHDFQIAQFLVWLEPLNHDYIDIPFASSIIFELHYDETCKSAEGDNSCFTVQVLFNNTPLRLKTCIDANAKAGIKSINCRYDDFVAHI